MTDTSKENEWWWPVVVDDAYFNQLRSDYPDKAEWSNESLADYFEVEEGGFSDTWDHAGDARDEYAEVAKHMLTLRAELDAAKAENERLQEVIDTAFIYGCRGNDAALAKLIDTHRTKGPTNE